jgi:hypothetical protein
MDPKEIQRFINEHIPYRMQAIAWGLHILKGTRDWHVPKSMEISIDGKLCIKGNHHLLTNPSIEMAIIYARVLLEFLGLKANKERSQLSVMKDRDRKDGDVGIENFKSQSGEYLEKVTHAHKSVAHLTTGPENEDDTRDLLELACCGVLTLVHMKFYRSMGLEPPSYVVTTQ